MQVTGLTDIGKVRKINEDSYFFSRERVGGAPNLFLVADGLGGHNAGEVASRMAIDTVVAYFREHPAEDCRAALAAAVVRANQAVYAYGRENIDCRHMGTTLVGLILLPEEYVLINIGDSRAYLYRQGELRQITKDHSPVQDLQESGLITEEEAFSHQNRNLISRAIGIESGVSPDLYSVPAEENDILLLCSDGLSSYLRRRELEEIFGQESEIPALAAGLIQEALSRGGGDNITVILVKNERESEAGYAE